MSGTVQRPVVSADSAGTPTTSTVYDISGNLFDSTGVVSNAFVQNTDGSLYTGVNGFASSPFIFCYGATNLASNIPFACAGGGAAGVKFYDKDKNFLSGATYTTDSTTGQNGPGNFPVPAGAWYCRFWWLTQALADPTQGTVVSGVVTPSAGLAYNSNAGKATTTTTTTPSVSVSRWSGKRMGLFGTSITALNVWQQQVANAKGMTISFDASIPGSHTGQAFDKLFATAGQPLPSAGGPINTTAFRSSAANTDLHLVELGTNDCNFIMNNNGAMGTADSPATEVSFMGYVEKLLVTLRTYSPNVPIIWVAPYHTERYPNVPVLSGEEASSHYTDAVLSAYVTALVAKCQKHGVPVIDQRYNQIDMFTMCDISTGAPNLLRDKLHPSTLGFATAMSPFISRHMELYAKQL